MFYGIWRTGQVKVLRPASTSHRGRNFTPVVLVDNEFRPIFAIPTAVINAISGFMMRIATSGAPRWHGFLCGDHDPTSIERIAEMPRTVKVYSDYDGIVEVAGEAYTVGGSEVLSKVVTPPSGVNVGSFLGLGAGYYDSNGVFKARTGGTGNITPNDIPVLIAGQNHSDETVSGVTYSTRTFQIVDILYSATGNAVFVCRVNPAVLAL